MQSFDINELFSKLKGLDQRKADDEIYAQIYDEYTAGVMDKVAQARAIEAGGGNPEKIKSEYIRFRFIRIKDEITRLQKAEREKQAAFDQQYKAQQKQQKNAQYEEERRKEELREEIRNRSWDGAQRHQDDPFGEAYDKELDKTNKNQASDVSEGVLIVCIAIVLIIVAVAWL